MKTFTVGRVRQKVLEVCNIQAGFGKTETMIHEAVNELIGGRVSLQEIRDAIEWNHGERFLRSVEVKKLEQIHWFITPEGIAEENIR